jgi:glycosyltransferase involved in cell wall biosynthesis
MSLNKNNLKPKLLIATTVSETLTTILQGQPQRLSQDFDTAVVSSAGERSGIVDAEKCYTVSMHRGISPFADIKSVFLMIQVIRSFKPDMLHSYTPKAGLICMVAGFLCRVQIRVHTFTGLIFPTTTHSFKRFLLKQVDTLICACATSVVSEGLGVKSDLTRFNVTKKPIQIVGHGNIAGLDSSYFNPNLPFVQEAGGKLFTKLNLSPESFIFLYMGRINRDKGLKELVEAFEGLNNHAVLWVVGAMDESAPPDPTTIKQLNNHPRIVNLGFLQDVRSALVQCHVVVLPSYREGFPNVLLQAGAMTKPVIATNINGSNEIVISGQTGWLVPAKDSEALNNAMVQAMQVPENERFAMGLVARKRIQDLYERDTFIQTLIVFYKSLLKSIKLKP